MTCRSHAPANCRLALIACVGLLGSVTSSPAQTVLDRRVVPPLSRPGGRVEMPIGIGFGLGLLPALVSRPRMAPPATVMTEGVEEPIRRRAVARAALPTGASARRSSSRAARPAPSSRGQDDGQVPGELLVELRPAAAPTAAARLARLFRLNLVSTERFTLAPVTLLRFRFAPPARLPLILDGLRREPSVAAAAANHRFTIADASADAALINAQYASAKLHLEEAHRRATGANVTVAVIDTGCDATHPSLAGRVADHFDARDMDGRLSNGSGVHGTAIAGLVAGQAPLAGSAPAARLLDIQVFDGGTPSAGTGQGTTVQVLRGLDWAAAHSARVINMSFAGPEDVFLARAFATGGQRGLFFVAAAGNAGPASPPLFPAADPNVFAVTATDSDDRLYPGAVRGRHIALAAPGVDLVVLKPGGAFGFATGTSLAAAEASGLAALLLQTRPEATPAMLRDLLTRSSSDRGPTGDDPMFGAGLADADAALRLAEPGGRDSRPSGDAALLAR